MLYTGMQVPRLPLINTGLSRGRSAIETVVQKLAAALIAGFATFSGGYAIWVWQLYRVAV